LINCLFFLSCLKQVNWNVQSILSVIFFFHFHFKMFIWCHMKHSRQSLDWRFFHPCIALENIWTTWNIKQLSLNRVKEILIFVSLLKIIFAIWNNNSSFLLVCLRWINIMRFNDNIFTLNNLIKWLVKKWISKYLNICRTFIFFYFWINLTHIVVDELNTKNSG
jgi:hypothetical protein